MNPRQLRLIAGFLTVFVLLSFAPSLPDLRSAAAELLAGVDLTEIGFTDELGNLLLVAAGGLVLSVGMIVARRRFLARSQRMQRVRPSSERALTTPREAGAGQPVPESDLARKLRKASSRGTRVPEIARQFGLSQDAVRVAIGRVATAPAARKGSSFRPRNPASPVPAPATAVAKRRSPYQVTA
jgi:hypothetical protein